MFASKPGFSDNEAQKAEMSQDYEQILKVAGIIFSLLLLLGGIGAAVVVSFTNAKTASLPHLPKSRLSVSAGAKMTSAKTRLSTSIVSSALSAVTIPKTRVSMMRDWMVGHKRLTAVILATAVLIIAASVILSVVLTQSKPAAPSVSVENHKPDKVEQTKVIPAADWKPWAIPLVVVILGLAVGGIYAYCRHRSPANRSRASKAPPILSQAQQQRLANTTCLLQQIKNMSAEKKSKLGCSNSSINRRKVNVSDGASVILNGLKQWMVPADEAADLYTYFYTGRRNLPMKSLVMFVGGDGIILQGPLLRDQEIHMKLPEEVLPNIRGDAQLQSFAAGLGSLVVQVSQLENL